MKTKVLQVFYNENGLPFKDQERTVHFPVIGSGFMGASNTTQIKFYFKEIGDDAVKYVAVSKLPNGKIGSKVLENYFDSELNEPYALLELDSYYTQYKGDLFISLQGYQGGVQVNYNEDTELYEIEGTPTIQATGSIKFTNNYATQFVGSGEEQNITLQQLLAIISDTVLRYYVSSSNTLAEVFNEIGTKICAIDIEGDEYLCEMSGDTNIVIYDIHNQEWYAFTGANTTTIDEVMSSDNKQIIATKEDLENFGNLFTYKGAASVSEINALTDIGNGWCYNLTDSGTLTLGNLQVEQGDNVAFNGTIWTKLSSETVLGNYYTKQEGQDFEQDVNEQIDAIENQVQQVASGSPKGVYATLADLQTAYPTGTTGIYVVSADGHWYYWSGSAWTDGGTYQATEIPDNSIDETKLTNVVREKINNTYNELFDIEENKTYELLTSDDYTLLTINGSLRVENNVINNNGWYTSEVNVIVVDVSEGEEYLISGVANNRWFSFLVALSDDNEIYSNSHNPSYFNDGSYDRFGGITNADNAVVNQYKIKIPAGVKKMYVESVNANGTQNFDFAKVFKVITSTDDSSIKENTNDIKEINGSLFYPYKEVVANTYDNNHTMYGYNSTTGHIFIDYNANPTGNYKCLVKFDVNEGEQFYISAYVLDVNSIMLTDNHLDLSLLTQMGYEINVQRVDYTGTNTTVNVNVAIPKGIKHIYIQTINAMKADVLCRKVQYKQIKKTMPVITFCRDMTTDDTYGEILYANGFNATYSLPVNKALAKKLASYGSDFGVYTANLSSTATKEEAKVIIDNAIAEYKAMGIYPPFTSMLCNGHRAKGYSVELAGEYGFRIIRANYKVDASGNNDAFYSTIGNNPDFIFDYVYSMDVAENTAQVINAYIDSWLNNPLYNKMHLCLFCHTIADVEEPNWHMTVAKFTAVVEHVKQLVDLGKCIVLNYRDYFNYYHPIEAFTDLNTKLLNATTDLKE